ncbi:MAG TPA: metal ABC transporter permease [Acidimicrobiales bacterium]|nr:metal ABC transporter permease [Acidimicrobiales bacterium]
MARSWRGVAMFSNFMINAWISGTIIALLVGCVGFFVVMRGSAFAAHAIPNGAFAGAAGANLIGVNPLLGLVSFALIAAFGIGASSRWVKSDVATALALVTMLALGAAFLATSTDYEPAINALLFGEILGVSSSEILPVILLAVVCGLGLTLLFRPLLYSSLSLELSRANGLNTTAIEVLFLVIMALASALAVPVVGALLTFSLMIGPPAAARLLSSRPSRALILSMVLSLLTLWLAIASSYTLNLPIGFFVGTLSALTYLVVRSWVVVNARRARVAIA